MDVRPVGLDRLPVEAGTVAYAFRKEVVLTTTEGDGRLQADGQQLLMLIDVPEIKEKYVMRRCSGVYNYITVFIDNTELYHKDISYAGKSMNNYSTIFSTDTISDYEILHKLLIMLTY